MNMNRVVMYTPTASGGHARYTQELLTALSRREDAGGAVELVTAEDVDARFRSGPYPVNAILPRLAHRREFRTPLDWALNRITHYPRCERRFLAWLAARTDVAAVHFQEHQPWRAERLFGAVKATGKAVFYSVHNVRPHKYPPLVPHALVDRWDRRAWRLCDGLFVLSDRLKRDLSQFLGRDHPPITVAPHGTWEVGEDAGQRLIAPPLEERLRRKRLLFFGNIRRNKGLDVLLTAMDQLPGYSLTVAGEPRERDYFDTEVLPAVQRLRAAGRDITLLDRFIPDEELARLFADHGALVLPYTTGFTAQSGVLFMALAYELPVVASDVGGLGELFERFRVGATFPAGNSSALSAAVRALHEEEASRADLAAEIRAAKQHYSWDTAAAETARAYLAACPPLAPEARARQPELIGRAA